MCKVILLSESALPEEAQSNIVKNSPYSTVRSWGLCTFQNLGHFLFTLLLNYILENSRQHRRGFVNMRYPSENSFTVFEASSKRRKQKLSFDFESRPCGANILAVHAMARTERHNMLQHVTSWTQTLSAAVTRKSHCCTKITSNVHAKADRNRHCYWTRELEWDSVNINGRLPKATTWGSRGEGKKLTIFLIYPSNFNILM